MLLTKLDTETGKRGEKVVARSRDPATTGAVVLVPRLIFGPRPRPVGFLSLLVFMLRTLGRCPPVVPLSLAACLTLLGHDLTPTGPFAKPFAVLPFCGSVCATQSFDAIFPLWEGVRNGGIRWPARVSSVFC